MESQQLRPDVISYNASELRLRVCALCHEECLDSGQTYCVVVARCGSLTPLRYLGVKLAGIKEPTAAHQTSEIPQLLGGGRGGSG